MDEDRLAQIEAYVRVWTGPEDGVEPMDESLLGPEAVRDRLLELLGADEEDERWDDHAVVIGSALLKHDARVPLGARPQLLIGVRGPTKQDVQDKIDGIVGRKEVLWNLFCEPSSDSTAALVAYVFVRKAPRDYVKRLRDEVDDPPLHFAALIQEGKYQAFAALVVDSEEEARDVVDKYFGSNPAGGEGVELAQGGTYGPFSLRHK